MSAAPGLVAVGISAALGDRVVVRDVGIAVPPGQLIAVIGPNGAGKTSLLRCLAGLLEPSSGSVRVDGQDIFSVRSRERALRIAYLPQEAHVDFPFTALDVVLMGRWNGSRLFRRWSREDREIAHEAIERVQLADFTGRQVGELSAGQRRRVLLARSIARGARLLLLDEPFAGLDAGVEHDMLGILDELTHEGCSILIATHDLTCVATACDEACCLNRRVHGYGAPADVLTEEVLARTFDRHLITVGEGGVIFDDAGANGAR